MADNDNTMLWIFVVVLLFHSCGLEDNIKKADRRIEALEAQTKEMECRAHTAPSPGTMEASIPTTDSLPTGTPDPQ